MPNMNIQALLLFVAKCSAITLEFKHVTEALPWRDAFVSGLCTTSHYVKGYVAPESLQADYSLTLDDISEAWVGLYGILTKFLKFDGCFMFEENVLNGENLPKVSFTDMENLLGSCYLFCNESMFGLSKDTCYCLSTVSPVSSTLCNVNSDTGIWFCKSGQGSVCGGWLIQETKLRCLCTYRPVHAKRKFNIRVPGDCVSYDVRDSKAILTECNEPKYYVCTENNMEGSVIFQNLQHSWWNAALLCQNSGQVFGNRSAVIQHVESQNSSSVESYWTNKFRKQFYSFLSPGKDDYDQCVAIRNESGTFKFFLKDCLYQLPALCFSVNANVTLPAQESTSSQGSLNGHDVSVSSTTIGETSYDGRAGLIYAVEKSNKWPVICVILGILTIIVLIMVMYHRKRTRNVKMTSLKPERVRTLRKPEPEVINRPLANTADALQTPTVPKDDNAPVAPTETQLYTSLAPKDHEIPDHVYTELNEDNVSMKTKDEFHKQSSNLQSQPDSLVVSLNTASLEDNFVSDETYNKLHEGDILSQQTMYDHTCNQDVVYDEIQTRNSKAQDDNVYDDVAELLK